MRLLPSILAIAACISGIAHAQSETATTSSSSPLLQGTYVAPFLSYTKADKDWLSDDGFGGGLALGYRTPVWAIEFAGSYAQYGADAGSKDTKLQTYGLNGLMFPTEDLPSFYTLIGGGYLHASDRVEISTRQISVGSGAIIVFTDTAYEKLSAYYLQGGIGYLFALRTANYEMAIRTELLARYADGDSQKVTDYVAQLGLQLPFGKKAPPPAATPVTVVPVVNEAR